MLISLTYFIAVFYFLTLWGDWLYSILFFIDFQKIATGCSYHFKIKIAHRLPCSKWNKFLDEMHFCNDLRVVQPAHYVNDDALQIIWINCELLLWNIMVFPKCWYVFSYLSSATLVYPLKLTHRWLKPVNFLKFSYRTLKAHSIIRIYWISWTTSL